MFKGKHVMIIVLIIIILLGIIIVWGLSKIHKMEISYINSVDINTKLPEGIGLNYEDWFIVTSQEQRSNLVNIGYVLPEVDFKEKFLVITRFKIRSLYYVNYCDVCTGFPVGLPIFDKKGSSKNLYYIYTMPPIWLSQAAG
jgi:hypothetical protein